MFKFFGVLIIILICQYIFSAWGEISRGDLPKWPAPPRKKNK